MFQNLQIHIPNILLLLLLSTAGWTQSNPPKTLYLDEAQSLALINNLDYQGKQHLYSQASGDKCPYVDQYNYLQLSNEESKQICNCALLIETLELTAQVKSAYLNWQFQSEKVKLLEQQLSFHQEVPPHTQIQLQLGAINRQQATQQQLKIAELEVQFAKAHDELKMTNNHLRFLLNLPDDIIAPEQSYEIYQTVKNLGRHPYPATSYRNFYQSELVLQQKVEAKACKKRFRRKAHLALAQKARIQAENTLRFQQGFLSYEVERLLNLLNQNFRDIRHYQDNILPGMQVILQQAQLQLDTEEINYQQYLVVLDNHYSEQLNYLNALNAYNQTAVQLEKYHD